MRHARDQDLDQLEDLLAQLRELPGLIEKKRGVFYRNSKSFLHFHEDPQGLFADLSGGPNTPDERIDVTQRNGRESLSAAVRQRLAS